MAATEAEQILINAVVRTQQSIIDHVARNEAGPLVGGDEHTIMYIWKLVHIQPEQRKKWNLVIWDMDAVRVVIELYLGNPMSDPKFKLSPMHGRPNSLQKYSA
jgi:hypothetical protein